MATGRATWPRIWPSACSDEALEPGRVPDGPLLADAISRANAAIRDEARTRPERLGMGTTCTVLVVGDTITIAHVGDSRAYRSRDGRLEQLTEDHSLVAALVRDGRLDPAAAASDPRRHVITRALGADDGIRVDVVSVDRRPGDRFLLCSDGVHGQLDDATIGRVLADMVEPAAAADRLIDLADAAGGEDNATAIVIDADRVVAGPIVDPVVADAPIPDIPRRSRRGVMGRLVAAAILVALIGAAAVWLAGGGLDPGTAVPSVAVPSEAVPSVSAPAPSVLAPSPSQSSSPASRVPSASASIPTQSFAAPGPS